MKIKVYVYAKCSTCKEALKFLSQMGIKADVKEITETPPSLKELQTMLDYQKGNLKKLFNVSGNLYREMQLAEKLDQMPESKALDLLASHGMLIKRPFLLGEGFGLLGFKEAEWSEKLANK
jgi:arsenate reductase (glutaredoxin)